MNTLNIVFPMGGHGSRFKAAGWFLPKSLYPINGAPMIVRVVHNTLSHFIDIPYKIRLVFILRTEELDLVSTVLKQHLHEYSHEMVFLTTEPTEGAVQTVLVGKDVYGSDGLLTVNCDQFIWWRQSLFKDEIASAMLHQSYNGIIQTLTKNDDPSYSYVRIDSYGYVTEVREKQPISNIATTGLYFWTNANDFVSAANIMIGSNIREKDEFYIAPLYNILIEQNKKFITSHVAGMHNLGSPESIQRYHEHISY